MTAREVQAALYDNYLASSEILIPRFTPNEWWECDMWRLTKSGYVDEFEIKVSVSDFRADAKKQKPERYGFDSISGPRIVRQAARRKHEILATDIGGPNRFWFVVPMEVAKRVECPAYAGLMVCDGRRLLVDKKAPTRHNRKWEGSRDRLLRTLHGRYWYYESAHRHQPAPEFED